MKQKGEIWISPEGASVPKKYLPPHEREFERIGQIIAEKAQALESKVRDTKSAVLQLIKEAISKAPQSAQKRFMFYTFDHGFRIEYDIVEGYIRVYEATKLNPSSKDYKLINLDFNKAEVQQTITPNTTAHAILADPGEPQPIVTTGTPLFPVGQVICGPNPVDENDIYTNDLPLANVSENELDRSSGHTEKSELWPTETETDFLFPDDLSTNPEPALPGPLED